MKDASLFVLILKQTKTARFLLSFAGVFLVCTLLIWMLDPDMKSWGDAIWFGFMLVTTTGFGDLTVTTWPARLVAVFLGLYGIVVIGFVTAVVASWLFEKVRDLQKDSVTRMIDQLEHLDLLDDRQVRSLQKKAARICDPVEGHACGTGFESNEVE